MIFYMADVIKHYPVMSDLLYTLYTNDTIYH